MPMQQERLDIATVAPLFFAAIATKGPEAVEICKAYVDKYPELCNCTFVDKSRSAEITPLEYAFYVGNKQCMQHLLEKGCCTNRNKSPLLLDMLGRECIDYAKILLSSGSLCDSVCKHNRDLNGTEKQTEDAYTKVFDTTCSRGVFNFCTYFILARSESKKMFMDRYGKVSMASNKSVPLPDEKFLHFVALGAKIPCNVNFLKYACVFPAVADEFPGFVSQCTTQQLAEHLKKSVFADALVTRNVYGLQALLQKLDLIMPDEATTELLKAFHEALEEHKQFCSQFVEEMQAIEARVRKQQINCTYSEKLHKLENVSFRFIKMYE
jgi:hypothetical protein